MHSGPDHGGRAEHYPADDTIVSVYIKGGFERAA
jgi:hypothetical protein